MGILVFVIQTTMTTTSQNAQAWQASIPQVAWGTLCLFAVIVGGYLTVIPAAMAGSLSYPVATLICTWLAYASFTVVHDAGHGSIFPLDSPYKRLESVMGWAASVPLLLTSFRFFQKIHDRHHAHTNCPDRDPDHIVSNKTWLHLLLSIYYIPLQYYVKMLTVYRDDPVFRSTWVSTAVYMVLVYGSLALLAFNGFALEVLCFAILPMLFALFLLVFFFDYVPHYPHRSQQRYHNTRNYPGRWLNWLLLGQNYHLIHHLYPRVPWYKYQDAYWRMAPQLESLGVEPDQIGEGFWQKARTRATQVEERPLQTPADTKSDLEQGERFAVSITLPGRPQVKLEVATDQTLLEAALASKERIPHACRQGHCGACKLRIVEGEAAPLPDNISGLTVQECEAGFTLACQCRPMSALVLTKDVP